MTKEMVVTLAVRCPKMDYKLIHLAECILCEDNKGTKQSDYNNGPKSVTCDCE